MTLRIVRTAALAAAMAAFCSPTPAEAGCGDFNADGNVTSTDALGVLSTAVGTASCQLVRCDVDDSGSVAATDALMLLGNAVGQPVVLDCPSVAVDSIDELPLATGPVGGGAGDAAFRAALEAVATGIVFGDLDASSFGPDSSIASCEVSNMIRDSLSSAAEGDKLMCYVTQTISMNEGIDVDPYDGELHVFALDFGEVPPGEDDEGPAKIAMRIVQNDDGAITDFEMFTCTDDGGTVRQDQYTHQLIDGPDFTMLSKSVRDEDGGVDRNRIEVTATFGDDGGFVGTKLVEIERVHDEGEWSGFGELVLAQGEDLFVVDGWDSGTFVHDGSSGTYGREIHAEAELRDFNVAGAPYSLDLLAMGHGAAKAHLTGSDNYGSWDDTHLQGWNGDTTLVDPEASSLFLDSVDAAELVESSSAPTIDFAEGETFDCSTPIEATIVVDMPFLDAQCNEIDLEDDWIHCHEIIDEHGGDGGEGDPTGEGDGGHPGDGTDPGEGDQGGDGQTDEGGDEGFACWSSDCDCDPSDPECFAACWKPECDHCWDFQCDCDPQDEECFASCWNPECDDMLAE